MDTARTLTENLAALLRREHQALAEFLVALADFDKRRVWAELGYASLFSFLHRELRLSKGAAQYRKVAVELIQEVPAEALLEAALDLLLAQVAKRRGLVEKPQRKPRPSNPYRPAARVRREVWKRDGACCSQRLESGEICGSTYGLQFDHRIPLALGGTSDAANIRLLCARHNLESARRELGDALMDRYVGKKARRRRAASPPSPELATLPGFDPPPGEPRSTSS